MDRSMKAEIESLRNEVVTNLKNIEGLVHKIDTKLAEDEELSCLSRCPEIEDLLNTCKAVTLHPDTDPNLVLGFQRIVDRVRDKMTVLESTKYGLLMADIIQSINRLDEKSGPLTGDSPMETLWEEKFPGVRETVEHYLEENGAVKPKQADVDDSEVQRILDSARRLTSLTKIEEDPQADPNLAPEWAKDVANKSSHQLWEEAAEWDDDTHIIFCRQWNSLAARRITLLYETLKETVEHVKGYNYYNESVKIRSKDDLLSLTAKYDALEAAKAKVIMVLETFDRGTLDSIVREHDNLDNWQRYYDWNARLISELERIAKEIPQGVEVASSCHGTLKVISAEKEIAVFDPMQIDTETFTAVPMKMPPDKLAAFRKRAQADYLRDLNCAYEWINKQTQDAA